MKFLRGLLLFVAGGVIVLGGTALAQFSEFRSFLPSFPDAEQASYYTESAEKMLRTGIITGYEDGRLGPHDFVTRAQIMVIIDRYDSKVVEPLRQHIAELREHLNFGRCGDGIQQKGEQCDDGNTANGDGCSSECIEEATRECPYGYKVGDTFPAPDGCNTCTCTLNGVMCTEIGCGEPTCGNGICDEGETSWCPPSTSKPCPLAPCQQGTCPRDCGLTQCDQRDLALDKLFEENRSCKADSDCAIFVRGCSPYLTCGKAVRKDTLETVTDKVLEYIEDCLPSTPATCALCVPSSPVCVNGVCTMKDSLYDNS